MPLQGSFRGADFRSYKAVAAGNTLCIGKATNEARAEISP